MIGGRRKLLNEELQYLLFSASIIITIRSRRTRWVRHIARMDGRRIHIRF
jgi:hypothetical protein